MVLYGGQSAGSGLMAFKAIYRFSGGRFAGQSTENRPEFDGIRRLWLRTTHSVPDDSWAADNNICETSAAGSGHLACTVSASGAHDVGLCAEAYSTPFRLHDACDRCWRNGWRSTACACTRTRRGWWSFADRRSRNGAARNARAASRCWGSRTTGGAPGRGRWVVRRKTAKDRFSRAARGIGQWCRRNRHRSLPEQHAALRRKLRGHYAYYGITGNSPTLGRFRTEVHRLWLGRRSWSGRMSWERLTRLLTTYRLPKERVVHSVYRCAARP